MKRIVLLSIIFVTALGWSAVATSQSDAPQHSSWSFDNPTKPDILPWSTYRGTYLNIPEEPAPGDSRATPDIVFYDVLYKALAAPGNCYGMALMSLLMNRDGEHLGFCLPVGQYSGSVSDNTGPTNPALLVAINMMHGHQLNAASAEYQLDLIATGNARDANFAYQRFNQLKAAGDYVLVNISRSLDPTEDAHTMVAYKAEDLGSGKKRIYVYNPNRPYIRDKQTWYDTNSNYISIDGHSWSFPFATDDTWSGSPSSGGYINVVPISLVAPVGRTPASLGLEVLGMISSTLVLSGAGASVEQVTDGRGRRLYRPGTYEVDTALATGMRSIVPLIVSSAPSRKKHATYLAHFGPSAGGLKVTIKADNTGYTLRSASGKTFVAVTARGGNGTETITLRYPASREPGVVLSNARGTQEYDVQLARVEDRRSSKVFTSSHLKPPAGAPVEVALVDRARAVRIASPKAALKYDLEMQSVRGSEREVATAQVDHGTGMVRVIRPKDWRNLKGGGIVDRGERLP